MGRVGTHLTDLSSGWGPSGRRSKSGLPDQLAPPQTRGLRVPRVLASAYSGSPRGTGFGTKTGLAGCGHRSGPN